jgi:hypothetical protein
MRCTVSDRRESIRTFLKIARITSVLLVAVFITKRQDQQYAQRHAAKGTPPPS